MAAKARRKEITTGADYLVAVEIGGERVVSNADHDPSAHAVCADAGAMSWLSGKPGMASMTWRLITLALAPIHWVGGADGAEGGVLAVTEDEVRGLVLEGRGEGGDKDRQGYAHGERHTELFTRLRYNDGETDNRRSSR